MDGVLIVNKPAAWTSHDVVQKARGILRERRIGHTGTLDPLATGVLVLCVGRATRIAKYLEAQDKEYRAVMRLGVVTDTLDKDGAVLEQRSYDPPSRERIADVMRSFLGEQTQRPPAYSALKVKGVPSYRLARAGKAVELAPRTVTIRRIELASSEDPFIEFSVQCSKGTYVRTLCADIGEALGTGAHLTALERIKSGAFRIDTAHTLAEIEAARDAGALPGLLITLDQALADLPLVQLEDRDARRVSQGNRIPWKSDSESPQYVRVRNPEGLLLAVARTGGGTLRPETVFS